MPKFGSPINALLHFRKLETLQRVTILGLSTAVLAFLIHRFLINSVYKTIDKILEIGERDLIFNLIYFEWPLAISFMILLVFIFSLLAGRPDDKNSGPSFLQERPLLAFTLSGVIFGFLIFPAPYLLLMLLKPGISDWGPFINHKAYLEQSLRLLIFLSISVADNSYYRQNFRWWGIIFLLIPYAPILWWNALAGMFPSKYWRLWRPILLALQCLIPLLAFMSEPSHTKELNRFFMDKAGPAPFVRLDPGVAYQVIREKTDEVKFYVNCDLAVKEFGKDRGEWENIGSVPLNMFWDEASYDIKNDLGYVYEGQTGLLYRLDTKNFQIIDKVEIPESVFPERSEGIHQIYFPSRQILVLGENTGRLVKVTLPEGTPILSKKSIRPHEELWRILPDRKKQRIFALYNHALMILNIEDFSISHSVEFGGRAIDCLFDAKDRRVYVSFPRLMEVMVFDADTLELLDRIPAPVAVRGIGLDVERGWLFCGSYGGIVEVRDVKTHKRIARARLYPFIRRLLPIPETGELVVTANFYPLVMWRYDPADAPFDLADRMLQVAEKAMKTLILLNSIGEPESQIRRNDKSNRPE